MKVLVVGATGILGRNVIPRLLEAGHSVRAVVRREEQARFLQQWQGVEAVIGDIFDRRSLERAASGAQAALHLAIAIPKNDGQDWSLNDRVRVEGTRNLLDALLSQGVRRYVQQSIALVYGEQGDEIVDETTPVQMTAINRSAIEMEEMVRASGLAWNILRGGLFYGPGTGREEGWWQAARRGVLKIPGNGNDLISLVHVVDMAGAVVRAVEHIPGAAGNVYNIVDDEPVRLADLYRYVAAQVGSPPPETGSPRFLPSLGVRNIKAQLELSWRPAYPNYRTGLAYGQLGGTYSSISMMTSARVAVPVQTEAVL